MVRIESDTFSKREQNGTREVFVIRPKFNTIVDPLDVNEDNPMWISRTSRWKGKSILARGENPTNLFITLDLRLYVYIFTPGAIFFYYLVFVWIITYIYIYIYMRNILWRFEREKERTR